MTEPNVLLGGYRITTIVTGAEWAENCYLILDILSGEQTLIDPGGDAERTVQAILDGGGQLNHILLTHAHHDHVGAVAAVCRRFKLSCAIHKNDVRLLRHAPMYALRFARLEIEVPEPFEAFEGSPEFTPGKQPIRVIHTPGHTAGSVCYHLNDFVFTGDTLLRQHVGRTDLPGGDPEQLKNSVVRLLTGLPENTMIFPGHGSTWTIGEARGWWKSAAALPPMFTQMGV